MAFALDWIALDQKRMTQDFPPLNATFPDLLEITDYLMIYQSRTLPSLTNIFPNLTVIRGNKLLMVRRMSIYKLFHGVLRFIF